MANIALNEDAQLNLNMEAMTENTEGHCDEWNVRHQQLLENDQYLNGEQEKIKAPEFTPAAKRENIVSKEKLPKIFGKIARFFSDLKEVAFSGKYSDLSGKPAIVNNNTTTEAGSALDARQANPTIEGTMANQILQLNNDSKVCICLDDISAYQRLYMTVYVAARTVHLEYTRFAAVENGTRVIIIPEGYRPLEQKVINALVISGDDTVQIGSLVIETNGDVKMQAVEDNINIRGSFVCEWRY